LSILARTAIALAVVGLTATPVSAQAPAPDPASQAAPGDVAPSPRDVKAPPLSAPAADFVAEGTLVLIELAEPVSSRTIKRGDMFKIRLAAPVKLGDRTVIPAGVSGMGQVVDAAPSGTLGRPAKLLLAARYLDVDGTQVRLRAMQLGRVGTDETGVVLATSFIPYVGFLGAFLHGGEIEIPAGTPASAKLAADVPAAPPTAAPPGEAPPNDAQPNNAPPAAADTHPTNQGDHP